MSREELLKEFYEMTSHNLYCYSADGLMSKAKDGFENSWKKEQEKLELIKELLEEERESKFKVYYAMENLYTEKDIRLNMELAYLEDRKNGVSCYLTADEINEDGKAEYILVFSIHKKNKFEDEFDNIYTKDINKEFLKNKYSLKSEMEKELETFKAFIKKDELYSKYYESKETEEFE